MPADPKDLLLAEMVVQTGFIQRETVNRCLAEMEKEGWRRGLRQVLLDGKHIDPGRMALVDKFLESEPAKKPGESSEEEKDFGRLVEMKRLAAGGEVELASKLLEEMKSKGAYSRLGDILLRKTLLTASQIHQILAEKGIRILRCKGCARKAEVKNFDPANEYRCKKCNGAMEPVDFSEVPVADPGMDVVVQEE
jgi:hypothetical protein